MLCRTRTAAPHRARCCRRALCAIDIRAAATPIRTVPRLAQAPSSPGAGDQSSAKNSISAPVSGSTKRRLNRSMSAPARRSQFFSPVATCSASSASSRCMCGFCRRGSFTCARPGTNSSRNPPWRGSRQPLLHELPCGVGKLDRARVSGRAEIPGEREQHEGVVVGVARVVERRAVDRDRAKPAAVRRARGAHQEGEAMARGLAERGIAAHQIGVAEHIGQARLHQRGAALIGDRLSPSASRFSKKPPAGS